MTNADDELEPIDVLLEEVLQEPAAPARAAWGPRLLMAATVLFGLAAVVGAFAWRGTKPPPKFSQQHQGPNTIVPKDRADFDRLLGTATGLRVERKEVVGMTRETPGNEHLDFEAWGQTLDVVGEDFAAWRRELAASGAAGEWSGVEVVLDVRVLLPGGKEIVCFVTLSTEGATRSMAAFGLGGDDLPPLQPNEALLARLRAANDTLERQHRQALGIARSLAELAELPEGSRAVECPAAEPEALRQALTRFDKLNTLRLRQSATTGAPRLDGAVLRAAARLPLAGLTVDAGSLTDQDLAALAAMPSLRRLAMHGGGQALTGKGLGTLASIELRELALVGCGGLTTQGLATITSLLRLRGLHLIRPNEATVDFARQRLIALPELRNLTVWSDRWTEEHLRGLAATKLTTVWFGEASITGRGLDELAALPSLQNVILAGTSLGDDDLLAAAPHAKHWSSLTMIQSAVTKEGLEALRVALPNCTISIRPGSRVLDLGYHLDRQLRD